MSTIVGQEILSRAAIILQDTTNVRWPYDELLRWLHDAQREIVLRKPDSYTKSQAVTLVISETKQNIPSDGIQLLDVVRNMGTAGTTPGRAITRISRNILDSVIPDWNTSAGSATVKHYMFDERNPKVFYVYPPQPAASPGYVELVYSASPDPLIDTWQASTTITLGDYVISTISNNTLFVCTTAGTTGTTEPTWDTGAGNTTSDGTAVWTAQAAFVVPQTITLDDVYASAILDYILYRAYSKDADLTPTAPQRAIGHYNAFMSSIGGKEQAEAMYDPNVPRPGEVR